MRNFSHFLVYATSSLAEQSLPAEHEIFDMNASVSDIRFQDQDLDETEIGGQVYTRSPLAEQTTPVDLKIVDSIASVSNISFPDFDLDEGDLGGLLEWQRPSTTGSNEIELYVVYFASCGAANGSDSCSAKSYYSETPFGTENLTVDPETSIDNFTHWLIYTRSSLVEQTYPVAHKIFDATSSVSGIQFTDKDLDALELGGTTYWLQPAYDARVRFYNVYLSADPAGGGRSQLGTVEAAESSFALTPDTSSQDFVFLAVYTESELVEQTTPVALNFLDRESLVQNVTFPDFDLDYDDLGGTLAWQKPADATQVTHYIVYMVDVPEEAELADDCNAMWTESFDARIFADFNQSYLPSPGLALINGINASILCNRSFYAWVDVSVESIAVPENLTLRPYTHWAVYAMSSLVEQSMPTSLKIYDMVANVSNITFQGLDLDLAHLGGTVAWQPPEIMERVYSYAVYLAESAAGDQRSQIGNEAPAGPRMFSVLAGTDAFLVPSNTLRESYTHFAIYTRSTLAEQTTPSSLAFLDEVSKAGNVTFVDDDLDRYEIGGDLIWLQPEDDSEVQHYQIYLAEDSSGSNRSLLGNASQGVHIFSVPPNTALMSFTHLTVFAQSILSEQTTPSSVLIVDTIAIVANLRLIDLDLEARRSFRATSLSDPLEIGGRATWTPPANIALVEAYRMYLAADASGLGRSQVGLEVPVGTNQQDLSAETALEPFSHVVVYTRSSLEEQSTPIALSLIDTIAQVSDSDILFPDFDLDETDLGGLLEWTEPADTSQVLYYDVYMVDVLENISSCAYQLNESEVSNSGPGGLCPRLHMGTTDVSVANLTLS
eukprot:s5903_g2.t1